MIVAIVGPRTIAGIAIAVLGLVTCASLLLDAGAGAYAADAGENTSVGLALLPSAVVGVILAWRRPRNPVGWLLLANALIVILNGPAAAYAGFALARDPTLRGSRFAAVAASQSWPLLFAPLLAIAYVFPDGRLPSPRWRPVAAATAGAFALTVVTGMLGEETLDPPFEAVAPYSIWPAGGVAGVVHALGLVGMVAALVLAFVAVGVRFRSGDAVTRAQLKWVAYAALSLPLAIVVGIVEGLVTDGPERPATVFAWLLLLVAVPAAIGVAVLRYRLYEIDRLISVTLAYVTLTALLAAAFAVIALLGGVVLGGGSPVVTAAATLAIAFAFRPLRDRVQAAVDRRLNPDAYAGLRRVDGFLADLREGRAEPEQVGDILASAVSDPSLRLFFWLPGDDAHADAAGQLRRELPRTPAERTPVRRGALLLGTVVHDPALAESRVLDAAVLRAGLAIEIARLRVEVRRQLAEVERSRARIVAAGDEERRRIERDLHDGAQQRLVSIGLDLRHLQQGLGPRDERTSAGLDAAVDGIADAIAELRELARGVRPTALDAGLASALRELASRTAVPIEIEATGERFSPVIEAAAYFVANEAVTNAIKHAPGSHIVVRMARANGSLVLSVLDDGPGGASPVPGSGLASLGDRVAALGGHIELTSGTGQGTSLTAELPCGS